MIATLVRNTRFPMNKPHPCSLSMLVLCALFLLLVAGCYDKKTVTDKTVIYKVAEPQISPENNTRYNAYTWNCSSPAPVELTGNSSLAIKMAQNSTLRVRLDELPPGVFLTKEELDEIINALQVKGITAAELENTLKNVLDGTLNVKILNPSEGYGLTEAQVRTIVEEMIKGAQPDVAPVIDYPITIYNPGTTCRDCTSRLNNNSTNKYDLSNADLKQCNFKEHDLSGYIFENADFRNACMQDVILSKVNMKGANLSGANLARAQLNGTNLFKADMRGANLSNATLDGAWLVKAFIGKAVMTNAKLDMADLTGSNLTYCDLRHASLNGTILSFADLTASQMQNSSLNGTIITKANFSSANLHNVMFEPAGYPDLASFSHATGLDSLNFTTRRQLALLWRSLWEEGYRNTAKTVLYSLLNNGKWYEYILQRIAFFWAYMQWGFLFSLLPFVFIFIIFAYIYHAIICTIFKSNEKTSGVTNNTPSPSSCNLYIIHSKDDVNSHILSCNILDQPVHLSDRSPLRCALEFSFYSMFNIHLGNIDFAKWVPRILGAEYTYRPYGKLKIISTLQTLSVIVLAVIWFTLNYSTLLIDFDWLK